MISIKANKALSFALAMAMSVSIMPTVFSPITVNAAGTKEITGLGTGAISDPSNGKGNWDYVYYGKYNGNAVKYRVLDKDSEDFGSDTLLLDCDNILYTLSPDENISSAVNLDSMTGLMKNLNGDGFLNKKDVFTDAEKDAIAISTKTSASSTDGQGINGKFSKLTGKKIFALDPKEATNASYGYVNSTALSDYRIKTSLDSTYRKGSWWLRLQDDSLLPKAPDKCYYVDKIGKIGNERITYSEGVSPAFNISLSSILFTSKVSGSTNEYKLTVVDDDMLRPGNIEGTPSGDKVDITFEYPSTKLDDTISFSVLLLKNEYEAGKTVTAQSEFKYIPLTVTSKAEGTPTPQYTRVNASFTLPAGCKNYYPYLISEKLGGANETDYASVPRHFDLDKTKHEHTWKITESKGDKVTTAADKVAIIACTECSVKYTVSLDAKSKVYDGKVAEVEVEKSEGFPDNIVVSEVVYKQHNDSKALSDEEASNCGEYDAVVGITAGSEVAEIKDDFKIEQRLISADMITLSENKYVYDGTEKKPKVTVELGDRVLTENVDYEVTYKDNIEPGVAKVIVTAKSSNFTGKAIKDFIIKKHEDSEINPKEDASDLVDKAKDKVKKDNKDNNSSSSSSSKGSVIVEVPDTVNAAQRHKVGDKIIDAGNTYIITSVSDDDLTVTFAEPKSRYVKNATIPLSIFDDGLEYRVTEIAANAFGGSAELKKVTIGENVSKVGKNAFYKCRNLKSIRIKTTGLTKKSVGKNAFKNIHPEAKVKVPKSKVGSYKKLLKSKGLKGKMQKVTK
ncbi:leucine-rich repeat protein [Butyrivibrio sp. AE3004]|uniref:leucine-rich repeat protein n=1 Tax=Butyrivibrio sp. AE3004 TaxID=1506994 RepID=UPI000494A2C1|nr:leucine-rich repeat protein [Butyrivibrio sp. AE3004]